MLPVPQHQTFAAALFLGQIREELRLSVYSPTVHPSCCQIFWLRLSAPVMRYVFLSPLKRPRWEQRSRSANQSESQKDGRCFRQRSGTRRSRGRTSGATSTFWQKSSVPVWAFLLFNYAARH